MPSDNTVSIGGLTFHDGPTVPADELGASWVLQQLEGWFGGLSVRSAPIDRPAADGVYDGPAQFGGRSITLGGTVQAADRRGLQDAMDRASALLSGNQRVGVLQVDETVRGVSRQAAVRLDGPILVGRVGHTAAEFSIPLFAPDPSKYGMELHSLTTTRYVGGVGRSYNLTHDRVYGAIGVSGALLVENRGNRDTWPIFRFVGPLTYPRVQLVGGAVLDVHVFLLAGQQLVIDTGAHTVQVGGASRRSLLSLDSKWFALPPGESSILFQADGGTGSVTVEWRDAWS